MFRYSIRTLLILTILVAIPLMIFSPRPLTLKSLPNVQPSTEVQRLATRYKLSDFRYISEDDPSHEHYDQEYSHVLISKQADGTIDRELVASRFDGDGFPGKGPGIAPFGGWAKLHDSIPTLEELNGFSTIDEFENLFGWTKMYDTRGSRHDGWSSCLTYRGFVIVDDQIQVTCVHLYLGSVP